MPQYRIVSLEYRDDWTFFSRLKSQFEEKNFVWFDSHGKHLKSEFSWISASPIDEVYFDTKVDAVSFLTQVRAMLMQLKHPLLKPSGIMQPFPFSTGIMGYFGFDWSNPNAFVPKVQIGSALPLAYVGLFDWSLLMDHLKKRAYAVFHPFVSSSRETGILEKITEALSQKPSSMALDNNLLKMKSTWAFEDYAQAFNSIIQHLEAGDCYQVNLAQHFSTDFKHCPWPYYGFLRERAKAPFGGYWALGDNQAIACFSPERFIEIRDRKVVTEPIKGTIASSMDKHEDLKRQKQLRQSPKNQAENIMIVDLLRNDINRSCIPGSVKVNELMQLESYDTVHHLVSSIEGILRDDQDALDLWLSCFPGGSITGAPKKSAIAIIQALEPVPRSIYCGSLMALDCHDNLTSNITIRTLLFWQGKAHCWGGGAIGIDSSVESEYQESMVKIAHLMQADHTQ